MNKLSFCIRSLAALVLASALICFLIEQEADISVIASVGTFLASVGISALTMVGTLVTAQATCKSADATKESVQCTKNAQERLNKIRMDQFRIEMSTFTKECKKVQSRFLPDLYKCVIDELDVNTLLEKYSAEAMTFSFTRNKWEDYEIAELILISEDIAASKGMDGYQSSCLLKFINDMNQFERLYDYFVKAIKESVAAKESFRDTLERIANQVPENHGRHSDAMYIPEYIRGKVDDLYQQYCALAEILDIKTLD